jgi:hypothetical protein
MVTETNNDGKGMSMERNSTGGTERLGSKNSDAGDIGAFATCLLSIPPNQFTILATVAGVLLTERLDLGQQNALGNFIVSVGQAILTAAAQGQLLQSDSGGNNIDMQQLVQGMKMQLDALENSANRNTGRR